MPKNKGKEEPKNWKWHSSEEEAAEDEESPASSSSLEDEANDEHSDVVEEESEDEEDPEIPDLSSVNPKTVIRFDDCKVIYQNAMLKRTRAKTKFTQRI